MHPVLFNFFGLFDVHTYGLMIALGFMIGMQLATREARRVDLSEEGGFDPFILDLTFWILIVSMVGVGFAWAHGLHGLAIILLAQRLGDAFEVDAATALGGGLAYVGIAAMTLTSFDRTARWLGPRRWALLHRAGLHWLWFIFALNWTASVFVSLAYLPFAVLTWGLAGLRLAALRARRSSGQARRRSGVIRDSFPPGARGRAPP